MKTKHKKIKLNIPVIMEFSDYHEINYVTDYLQQIIKGLKSEELSFRDGSYWGIFYIKTDKKYKSLVKEHKKLVEEYEKENYG